MPRLNSRVSVELTKTEIRGLLALAARHPFPGRTAEKLRERLAYVEEKDRRNREATRKQ